MRLRQNEGNKGQKVPVPIRQDGEYEVSEVSVVTEDDENYGKRTHLQGKTRSWYQGNEFSSYQGLYLTKEEATRQVEELKQK